VLLANVVIGRGDDNIVVGFKKLNYTVQFKTARIQSIQFQMIYQSAFVNGASLVPRTLTHQQYVGEGSRDFTQRTTPRVSSSGVPLSLVFFAMS